MRHRIFELTQLDAKTLQERSLKLCEEAGELAQAVLCATGAPGSAYKNLNVDDVREEAADAAIVALSVLAQTCDNEAMFQEQIDKLFAQKCDKWQSVLKRSG
ncbi:MazG-like family protein [Roseibium sp.]|uniref:MazG-like family protein n=1 Tax=Roseibium sp. TaxID=1936156 RepID=UPI0032662350